MKKSRIIALLTAAMMIMSMVPAYAAGYFVGEGGAVYEKDGENLVKNPGFEDGLYGLTTNSEYYEVSQEAAHEGEWSLKAIKSTKGDGAITAYFEVTDPADSYYLSFWYKNVDDVARRPRVTFAFTDSSKTVPTEKNDFTEATNAWIGAGTASNDCDMEYSKGDWVQYSTVINGTGSSSACAYVVLNIYGLTKNVTYVDDFEVYSLKYSDAYGKALSSAVTKWSSKTMPKGPLAGVGTLSLPADTSVEGISVEWKSSSELVDVQTGLYHSGADEELVVLTARLYADGLYDEVYYEFEYAYIVKSMFEPYIEWIQTNVFEKLGTAISGDLSLPNSHTIAGYPEATFAWSCSDENVLTADGKYTAPEVTCSVDIIATITCGGSEATTTKTFKALGGNLIPEGLEMYYDFESPIKSNKVYDNAQKTYNATVEGVTITDGYAFVNGTIILPSDYAVNLTGSYSVSMWVKLNDAIASSGAMYRFFDFGGGTYTSQFLRYIPGSGQLTFMDRGTASSGSDWAIDKTVDVGKGGWSLVSFTYDKTDAAAYAKVYVDGVEVGNSGNYTKLTNSIYQVASQSSQNGFFGRTQWKNAENPDFYGWMDDIRIYSRALSGEEITTLYENTRPTVVAPVTIKYQDVSGEELKEAVTVSADVGTTYDVPQSYKSLPSTSDDQYRYVYKYVESKSTDSVYVSADSENVCILVFQLEKQAKGNNLIANGSFEENLDGWTYNNNGTFGALQGWARSTEVVYEGNYSLKKTVTEGNGGGTNNNIGTYIPIESGKKYTLSWWEHSSADKAAGSHQMMAAVVTSDNTSALGSTSNRIVSCGGWDSWNQAAMGQATRDPAYTTGWTQRVFNFDTTNTPNAAYILIAYANGDATSVDYLDAFVLEEESGNNNTPDDGEKYEIVIRYQDLDGNTIKDSDIVKVSLDTVTYEVPDSYKTIEKETVGEIVSLYLYKDELSTTTVNPSMLRDNICTLVFDVITVNPSELVKADNLVPDGDFKGNNGKFSWGSWQSPETGNYFRDKCEDWFYQVNRDTDAAALYLTGLTADNYALGTRWNDGITGLCSMANFIPVEGGKTYIVTYDYKHKNPSAAQASYISTSFQKTKNMSAGDKDYNIPTDVSTQWQTNTFAIVAPTDGYIYFHFSWLGESNNGGGGPFWYFDNVGVYEVKPDILEAEIKNVGSTQTTVRITNLSEENETINLKVYAASYSDNVLTAVESTDVSVEAGKYKDVVLNVGQDQENKVSIKVFLWEENMQAAYKTLIWK
ncbi:MAG: LamG-like jellyroll fold domain-containing protein [Clostridia bacterium]